MDEKQLLLKVPSDLKQWLKIKSVELDRPMKDLVIEACKEYLKRYENEGRK